ncbi:MAG TPA: hypothetical protein VL068_09755, partial [Microthrixaceae bacterium]|nr:hypothetical protein [Microthrixaceae bacterium]
MGPSSQHRRVTSVCITAGWRRSTRQGSPGRSPRKSPVLRARLDPIDGDVAMARQFGEVQALLQVLE